MKRKLYVIKSITLDSEEDMIHPDHPHLYWSNDWGWGTFEGATVHDERGKQENSTLDGTPAMAFEACSWEEIDPKIAGTREYIDDYDGSRIVESCIDLTHYHKREK